MQRITDMFVFGSIDNALGQGNDIQIRIGRHERGICVRRHVAAAECRQALNDEPAAGIACQGRANFLPASIRQHAADVLVVERRLPWRHMILRVERRKAVTPVVLPTGRCGNRPWLA